MIPYILNVLHYSGASQNVPSICRKLRQFNITSEETAQELETSTKEALERLVRIGLVRKNSDMYALTNKWYVPETHAFQMQLHEVVQNMPEALNEATDSSSEEFTTTANLPSDCMGPGMRQQRSPAQIRAIAIYRRMREQRERERREAAERARKRNSESRSRSRTRRSRTNRTRSRSKRRRSTTRSRSRSRSTPRARSTSRSRRR